MAGKTIAAALTKIQSPPPPLTTSPALNVPLVDELSVAPKIRSSPAGIHRLSMREERFYGVEALRMTPIDGRDPKNRTGLLTHTNLLRGQIGSHGCVAFQNYQPFLRAFKRGQINTLVVVPALPSSSTQLAALYRRAGA